MGYREQSNTFWPRLLLCLRGWVVDVTAGGSLVRISLLAGCCPCLTLTPLPHLTLQVRYKEEFEKNKGKGFSVVADTPELQRIKKTQDQISNVCSPARRGSCTDLLPFPPIPSLPARQA